MGAGSYVFGPAALYETLIEQRLAGAELALTDVSPELVRRMAEAGNRIARERGVSVRCTAHTSRDTALAGAQFVISAAARDMRRRFTQDSAITRRHDPDALVTEFGGPVGISYSLRQIALHEEIAADLRRLCPSALLLSSANPLPRVCQATAENGVATVGLCSVLYVGLAAAWQALTGQTVRYPFTEPRAAWDSTNAGVNHLAFLVGLRDQRTGEELLPKVREAADRLGNPQCAEILRRTGGLISSGDEHSQDPLPPDRHSRSIAESSHGTDAERAERLALFKAVAAGEASYEPLFTRPSWEKPVAILEALSSASRVRFEAFNLVHAGQIAALPPGVLVETPAWVSTAGIEPMAVDLPPAVAAYCRPAAELSEPIVRAALSRSRKLVHDAVELDPTVVHKPAGHAAMDALLGANADLLPTYH